MLDNMISSTKKTGTKSGLQISRRRAAERLAGLMGDLEQTRCPFFISGSND
jgi:hypothetical protein